MKTAAARSILLLLIAALYVAGSGRVHAQESLLNKANKLYADMAYTKAAKAYEQFLKKNERKAPMANLADCYRLTFQYEKAAYWYKRLVDYPKSEPIHKFLYGQALMNLGKYSDAKEWFLTYTRLVPEDPRGLSMADACANVDRFKKDSAFYSVLPIPINSKESDFCPTWYEEGIVFSSSRGEAAIASSEYDYDGQPLLDMYYTVISPDGNGFSKPKAIKGRANSRYHDAAATFDYSSKTVYFTRNNFIEGKSTSDAQGINHLQIFYADMTPEGWNNIRALPFNSPNYSVGHPSVSKKGNILYFVSDMPGGFGGTDIYLSYRREDSWSQPINLGPKINTPGNEMFPFMHEDRTLYFASDGHGGLGGLDIFSAEFDTTWKYVKNLGAPFNTTSDDFSIILAPDKDDGFFASNRPGGLGSDDIYKFRILKPLITGIVVRDENDDPVKDAKVVVQVRGENRKDIIYSSEEGRFSCILEYDEDYRILIIKPGYLLSEIFISTIGMDGPYKLQREIRLKRSPVKLDGKILESITGDPVVDAQIRIIGEKGAVKTDSAGRFELFLNPAAKTGYPKYEPDDEDCTPEPAVNLCYRFYENGPNFGPPPRNTRYEWDFGDGTKAEGMEVIHCFEQPGKYRVRLNLVDNFSGHIFISKAEYDMYIEDVRDVRIACTDTIVRGIPVLFDGMASAIPGCVITDYYWSFHDSTGQATAYGPTATHTFDKAGTFKVKLEVTGRGDIPGTFCKKCVTKIVTVKHQKSDYTKPAAMTLAASDSGLKPVEVKIGCDRDPNSNFCFHFFDKNATGLPESGSFEYEWDFGDGTRLKGEQVDHCFEGPGRYFVHLNIRDNLTGLISSTEATYDFELEDSGVIHVTSPLRLAAREWVYFSADIPLDVNTCTDMVYEWDFGDGNKKNGQKVRHIFAREGEYAVTVRTSRRDLAGLTQCEKCYYKRIRVLPELKNLSELDSLLFSENDTTGKYLDPEKIYYIEITKEGYVTQVIPIQPQNFEGDIQLDIEFSTDPNLILLEGLVTDDSAGLLLDETFIRLRNETTGEMRSLVTPPNGYFSFVVEPNTQYTVTAERGGYLVSDQTFSTVGWQPGKQRFNFPLKLQKIDLNKVFVLKNIYYDFGKWDIRPDARPDLDKLSKMLEKNPNITIELSSHTDSRGDDVFNLNLSQLRANSAVQYLIGKGTPSKRIVAVGYGEQHLLNRCDDGDDCTKEQHALNRRTEFRIIGFKDPIYSQALTMLELTAQTADTMRTDSGITYSIPLIEGKLPSEGDRPVDSVIYSIQIGVLQKALNPQALEPLGSYRALLVAEKLENATRLRVGNYNTWKEAVDNLFAIRTLGFKDAFIVPLREADEALKQAQAVVPPPSTTPTVKQPDKTPPVNNNTKGGTTSTVPVPDPNENTGPVSNPYLTYKILLGEFENTAPQGYFNNLGPYKDAIEAELFDGGKRYMVGKFRHYAKANEQLAWLVSQGYNTAKVVAVYKSRKVSIEEARRIESGREE